MIKLGNDFKRLSLPEILSDSVLTHDVDEGGPPHHVLGRFGDAGGRVDRPTAASSSIYYKIIQYHNKYTEGYWRQM